MSERKYLIETSSQNPTKYLLTIYPDGSWKTLKGTSHFFVYSLVDPEQSEHLTQFMQWQRCNSPFPHSLELLVEDHIKKGNRMVFGDTSDPNQASMKFISSRIFKSQMMMARG